MVTRSSAAPLMITVITILLQLTVDLESQGIPIIKEIPKGLPTFSGEAVLPLITSGNFQWLLLSLSL